MTRHETVYHVRCTRCRRAIQIVAPKTWFSENAKHEHLEAKIAKHERKCRGPAGGAS